MSTIMAYACATLLVVEIVLVVGSWMLSALRPDWGLRSLLDGAGVRWLFRSSTSAFLSPPLVWILLIAMTWGIVGGSGVLHAVGGSYRSRIAVGAAIVTVVVYVAVILVLTAVPHAVLLSPTGHLFPSSFSGAIVAVVCLGVSLFALVFGVASGNCGSMAQVFGSAFRGVALAAPVIVAYLMAAHCWRCLSYIFGL